MSVKTVKTPKYRRHPLSAIFPEKAGEPLELLARDIKEKGQYEPILLFGNQIVSGWRRYLACSIAGVEPKFEEFKGTEEEASSWVWSHEYCRRDLDSSDRPLVAARYKLYLESRKKKGLDADKKVADIPDDFGTSRSSLDFATKVLKKGEPELIEAVEQGHVTISDAAKVAEEKPAVQRKAVKDVMNRKTKTAAGSAKKKPSKNGQPVFDDKQISEPYGKLIRACVDRRKFFGLDDKDPKFSKVNKLLKDIWDALEEWGVKP